MVDEQTHRDDSSRPARRDADFPAEYAPADDEISLYDLWNVLARRRYVLFGIFFLIVAAGLLFAVTRPTAFEYRSTVEIGALEAADGETRLVEAPSQVRSRLRNAIIPAMRVETAENQDNVPQIELQGEEGGPDEEGGSLIILASTASPENADIVDDLHQQVIDRLESVHNQVIQARRDELRRRKASLEDELAYIQDDRVLAAERGERRRRIDGAEERIEELEEQRQERILTLETEIEAAERQLEAIDQRRDVTSAEIDRLDTRAEVLGERIETTEQLLADLRDTRTQIMTSGSGDSMMGLLLGSSNIEATQQRLDSLRDRLQFGLPERRDELQSRIEELDREAADVQDTIDTKQAQLDNVEADFRRQISEQERIIAEQETELARMEADQNQEVREQERSIESVEAQVDQILPTRPNVVGVQSLQPAGRSKSLILALSVVLGGMLGVFGAFFWEFVSNARRYRRSEATG